MYLLNGETKHCIEFSDRGFQYGDGLFETIEIDNGIPVFLNQHLQRLAKGCQKLLIPLPDTDLLTREANQLASHSAKAVLKLMLTRGSGGRGYRQPEPIKSNRLFSLHPNPDYPESLSTHGIVARFCHTRLGLNPALAGIKHMNRLEQVMARAEWSSQDIHEGIMMDNNGNVIEGTMSNIFLVKDNILYTPSIESCGVEGILRNIVKTLAAVNNIQCIETTLQQEDVYAADEIFVTNSIIGLWPIHTLEQLKLNVGPMTKALQSFFSDYKQEAMNVS